jgi:hypothetical protein
MRAPRSISRVILHAALASAACACASAGDAGAGDFGPDPLVVATSDAARLSIEVRTAPDQPPSHGAIRAEYRVRDAMGAAVDGLAIEVVPFMVAMGHGASVAPTVSARGEGRYVVESLDLFMAGRWELRTTFTGRIEDRATIAIDVR